MALLATSFALKNYKNGKYLRYVTDEGPTQKLLQCSGEDILDDPNAKFGVEAASTGTGLVHIRSSYSNKYWMRLAENDNWVAAAGEGKEEDQSKWSCTLFEPVRVAVGEDNKSIIRLRHIQSGRYLKIYTNVHVRLCMNLMYDKPDDSNWDLFTVTDWASLVVLPKHIALKGDNGLYLGLGGDSRTLLFCSDDIGAAGVAMEVVPAGDANIRIKATETRSYWSPNLAGIFFANNLNEKEGSLFKPIKVSDTTIALKVLNNNLFCRSFEGGQAFPLLKANTSSITRGAELVVEEPVLKRSITVTYRLEDARIYGLTPIALCTVEHRNDDDEPLLKTVTLTYKTELTTSWQASNSWTVGAKATIEVTVIPFISKGTLELSAEYGGSYTWGETKTEGQEFSDSDQYTVRGKHRLIVSKLATKGHCDVPYSYIQTDTMRDGKPIITTKSDGVFKGVNYFNIYTESKQIPI